MPYRAPSRTKSGRLDFGVDVTAGDKAVKKQVVKKRKRLGRIDLAAKALREAMWHVIARHREEDGVGVKQAMRRVFTDLDRRGTGYLGLKDLRAALQVRVAQAGCGWLSTAADGASFPRT